VTFSTSGGSTGIDASQSDSAVRTNPPPVVRGPPGGTLGRWARHPEYVVPPAILLWLLANLDPALVGANIVGLVFDTARLQPGHTNAILVLTYPLAIVSLVGSWWFLRPLGFWRAGLVALTVPFAWLMLFEVPWHLTGYFSPNFPSYVPLSGWVVLASWSLVGALSLPYWKFTRSFAAAALVFVVLWVAWLAAGYPQIVSGTATALAFNFVLKGWAFLTFILLLWPFDPLGAADDRVANGASGPWLQRRWRSIPAPRPT
jgi:hypothetical protein